MNRTYHRLHRSLFLCAMLSLVLSRGGRGDDLAVPYVPQQYQIDTAGHVIGYNWCWAACSTMVLNYYSFATGISQVVGYGVGNQSYDTTNYMAGAGSSTQGVVKWSPSVSIPVTIGAMTYTSSNASLTLSYNGIDKIIKNFSSGAVPTQMWYPPNGALNGSQIDQEINTFAAPFVIRYQWTLPGQPTQYDGGHFVVCNGYDSGILSILDPDDPPASAGAESYMQALATITSGSAGSLTGNEADDHSWSHTLTTSKALDVVFLFDTTGSMGPYLSDVQAEAIGVLDAISSEFKNYRVAVADYKDEPPPLGPGDYGDYVYNVDQPFVSGTSGNEAVIDAIYSLSAEGGGDTPEAVYSALYNTLIGNDLEDGGGVAWRPGAVRRLIILSGDAPGHDPEPWPGGHSFSDVIPLATGTNPISINCINPGTAADTTAQFEEITAATGGAFNDGSAGIAGGAESIIADVDANPRFPQGTTGSIYPTFTFDLAGSGGMANPATEELLDIQKLNARRNVWSQLRLVTFHNPETDLWTSTFPLAQGDYRWRLGFKRPASKLYLPGSNTTVSVPATTSFETTWTDFTRVANPPNVVTIISPPTEVASSTTVTYSFGAVPGAASYIMEIYQDGKLWRTYKLRPPATDPTASVLSKTVKGEKLNLTYSWRVQALNADRPKPDAEDWSYSEYPD